MYRADKHNVADVFNRQFNYVSEVKKNNCLLTLQSKLKAMRTVTPKSFEPPKGKPNKADHTKHINSVFTLMRYKSIIRDEFKMNWHKLPESPIKKPNEADCIERINSIITLMGYKLTI